MKILLTGGTGFIGRKLAARLNKEGHELVILSRHAKSASQGVPATYIACDLAQSIPPQSAYNGIEAIIHLAGASVATGRWTEAQKKLISESRIQGTQNLIEGISTQPLPPSVLIS